MKPKASTFLVVDDHPTIRQIHCSCLEQVNAEAHCIQCETPQEAKERLKLERPELAVIDLMYLVGGIQTSKPGLALLEDIFRTYPLLNLLVCTSEPLLLRPLTEQIQGHEGGFMVVDKNQTSDKFIQSANYALDGLGGLPRILRSGLSISDLQLMLLSLMCEECLTTSAIATRMNSSMRAVEYHIKELKEALLDTYDDKGMNTRVAICQAASKQKLLQA